MDRPKTISQGWENIKYDWNNRKWIVVPRFYMRQNEGDKKKRISLEKGLELIKLGYLTVNSSLREWLDENGYQHIKKLNDEVRISKNNRF